MGSDYNRLQEENIDLGLPFEDNARGVGTSEEASAILSEEKSRMDCAMAIHVLDILKTMEESNRIGKTLIVSTNCERPKAL